MKTYSAKPSEVESKWYVIDAEGLNHGRLTNKRCGSEVNMPMFTPHIDCGDNIIVVNAERLPDR